MSEKLSIFLPSIAVTTSPTWKPAAAGGAVGLDLVDARRRARLAEEGEQAGENHDRQQEIRDRTGGDDGRARADFLVMEAACALLGGHAGERSALEGVEASLSSPKNFT